MNISEEVELKLELDPSDMKMLLADSGAGQPMSSCEQHSVYFDTEDGDLRKAGLSLRVRHAGGRRIQTLKADAGPAAGLFARGEWEREIASDTPELDVELTEIIREKMGHEIGLLQPLFTASVVRASRTEVKDGASIDLVADLGSVVSGERSAPICEIEMELREGEPKALFAMARTLDARMPLRLGVRTKSERGYRLAAGEKPGPVKAEHVALRKDISAAAAFQAIAGACIRHFRLNEDLVIAAGDAEAVHQTRVAFRRLRSAMSIFRRMIAGADAERLRGEIKWIMGLLGEVRNLDVLIKRSGDAALRKRLRVARRRAIGEAVKALESRRFRELMLDLAEWIAVGSWLETSDPKLRGQRAKKMAEDAMDRLWRRLRRQGKALDELDEESRHEVRILAKKTRYAAEFFADLFPGKKARERRRAFLAAIEELQSHLGDLNDVSVAEQVLEKAGIEADCSAFALQPEQGEALIAKAGKAYDELAEMKRFWR